MLHEQCVVSKPPNVIAPPFALKAALAMFDLKMKGITKKKWKSEVDIYWCNHNVITGIVRSGRMFAINGVALGTVSPIAVFAAGTRSNPRTPDALSRLATLVAPTVAWPNISNHIRELIVLGRSLIKTKKMPNEQ